MKKKAVELCYLRIDHLYLSDKQAVSGTLKLLVNLVPVQSRLPVTILISAKHRADILSLLGVLAQIGKCYVVNILRRSSHLRGSPAPSLFYSFKKNYVLEGFTLWVGWKI